MKKNIEIRNKRARFDYDIIEEFVAGIVLNGGEIKSIRNGNASISESYCYVIGNSVIMKAGYVKQYSDTEYGTYDERRDRCLLLTKREIARMRKFTEMKGCTAVPLKMYINDHGLCKVVIGLCKGKHTYDKKQDVKERDIDRETKRNMSI